SSRIDLVATLLPPTSSTSVYDSHQLWTSPSSSPEHQHRYSFTLSTTSPQNVPLQKWRREQQDPSFKRS
ncbi:hypothetical protein, partial [Sporisorium scitamineum]